MWKNLFMTCIGAAVLAGIVVAGPDHDHGKHAKAHAPLPDCPIMGEPINLAISTPTEEGPVFFCCDGCVKKYKENQGKYSSVVAAQRKALADRPKVQTTCPVSGKAVDRKVSIEVDGNKVHFCCQGCVSKYQSDPKKYAAALANSYTYQMTCPVMGNPIDPTSYTELADGRKIYYCCDGCEGPLFKNPAKYAKNLASQGLQYNWAKIKKAGDEGHGGHDHGHGHGGHDHDHDH